ncbi:hypothetical protein JCM3775_001954 [Rhodotorula graminis]
MTPLVAAGAKPPSRTASLLVHLLLAKGARLPAVGAASEWLGHVRSWAIELVEGGRTGKTSEEQEAKMLLDMDFDAVDEWCRVNLPAPTPQADPSDMYVEATLGAPRSPPPPSAKAQGKKRAASRSRSRSPARSDRRPPPRAHLRVDNLPVGFTSEQLLECFDDVPGVLDVEVHLSQSGALWGFVSLASLATAQHAFATKNGTHVGGAAGGAAASRPLWLKIYSVDGTPIEPHRQVEPVVNNPSGAMPGVATGAMPGVATGAMPPPNGGSFQQPPQGAPGLFGNFRPGVSNPYPRGRFLAPGERPRVPYIFTAAELARRVYCGSLRFEISYDEVASLFAEKAGVVAKVLKVMNAFDNSHSFAFVQLPDAITAEHAIKVLHGSMHEGHLLQIEHVNELNHRWLFSLSLQGLPVRWRYQDVSDFLISTIGSFAGLIVNAPRPYDADRGLQVRVELRYETELRWAFTELDGLPVEGQNISARIEQPRIREKMERELAYRRIAEQSAAQAASNAAAQAAATSAYSSNVSIATASEPGSSFPPLGRESGSMTPGGGRRPPPPPPPPPPQANGSGPSDADESYNPFALSFLK